jgi:CheY-like chemotaxis protein
MPSPDGFDVVQILRREKAKSTPLLVYTARDLNQSDKENLTLGLSAHLTKSRTSEQEFLDTVKNLLNGLVSEHQKVSK